MSALVCERCGGLTNTAVADHMFKFQDNRATRCFAKFVEGQWGKGCAYEEASNYEKEMADALIRQPKL